MGQRGAISLNKTTHKMEKVHELIDIHGQVVAVYRCAVCGVRARIYSPHIRDTLLFSTQKYVNCEGVLDSK